MIFQKNGEEAGQPHKTAESHGIEETEEARVTLLELGNKFGGFGGRESDAPIRPSRKQVSRPGPLASSMLEARGGVRAAGIAKRRGALLLRFPTREIRSECVVCRFSYALLLFPFFGLRRFLGGKTENEHHHAERDDGQPEYGVPAEGLGQARREKRGQQCPGSARARDAHHQALVLGRIPAAGQWQGRGEARARRAELQAGEIDLPQRVGPLPARHQWRQCEGQTEAARVLRPNRVGEITENQPQHRAGEQRDGGHQPLLRRTQAKIRGDVVAERSQQDPHHEADVEV